MLRSQDIGRRVALGLSGLYTKGLLSSQSRGLQFTKSVFKWDPIRVGLSGSSQRFCSILGSPACGSHPGPGQGGLFHEVLEAFPKNRCYIWIDQWPRLVALFLDWTFRCLVFAYGSGVFQQQGQQTKDNMTDFIFCVEVHATIGRSVLVEPHISGQWRMAQRESG